MSRLVTPILEGILRIVDLVPLSLRYGIVRVVISLWFFLSRRARRTTEKNLELVFFDQTPAYRKRIRDGAVASLAKLIVDALRAPFLTDAWIASHVEPLDTELFDRVQRENPGKGILLVTGHLGSFELVPHVAPYFGLRFYFHYRKFRPRWVDTWFLERRMRRGCKALDKVGSLPTLVKLLNSGANITFMVDQNVKRNHAVFAPFFGELAATSRAVAVLALKTEAPIVAGRLEDAGFDRYGFYFTPCAIEAIRSDPELSQEEKIQAITRAVNAELEKLILRQPERWFWFHRRWRTRPTEGETSIYE